MKKLVELFDDILNTEVVQDPSDFVEPVNFDKLFTSFVYAKYSFEEVMSMQLIWSNYTKAFKEVKAGRYVRADFYYKKGEKALKNADLTDEQIIYLNVYIYPNVAYYEYRHKRYDSAAEYVQKAIKCIGHVEQHYPDAHMSKVQQLHNVTRIYYRTKQYDKYIHETKRILRYLMLGEVPADDIYGLDTALLNKCTDELVFEFVFQIFSEFLTFYLAYDLDVDMQNDFILPLQAYDQDNYIKNWLLLNNEIENIDSNKTKLVLNRKGAFLSFKLYTLYHLVDHLQKDQNDDTGSAEDLSGRIISLLNYYGELNSTDVFIAIKKRILDSMSNKNVYV